MAHLHPHTQSAPATRGRTIGWARHYDLLSKILMPGRLRKFRQQIIQQAAIPAGAAVLDVGCGTGSLAILAKAQAGEAGKVYGIDASPQMIAVAQEKAVQEKSAVDFQVGVIEALAFPDGTFDVVLSSLMFHHLPSDLKQSGLTEIYRVLKPGGRLLVVDLAQPTTLAQRMSLMMLIHQGLASDVHDLVPLMQEIGYVNLRQGKMRWGSTGFVEGRRAN